MLVDTLFKSEDNDFVIAKFQKIGGDEVVVKGNIGSFKEDSLLTLTVEKQFSSYGEQHNIKKAYPTKPYNTSVYPMYLKANFKNIGDIRSLKIYNHFKDTMITALDDDPSVIDNVSGIGEQAKRSIKDNWKKVRLKEGITHEFIITMYDLGFSVAKVNKMIKVFQHLEPKEILSNPYILITYGDIPFNIVDDFALKVGVDRNSPERILAGIEYYSLALLEQGDCYMQFDVLYKNLSECLTDDLDILLKYLEIAEKNEIIKTYDYENNTIVMPHIYDKKENDIVFKIKDIQSTHVKKYSEEDIETLVDSLIVTGIKEFNPLQKEAIACSITSPVSIITGGPGTGKTTVLRGIIKLNQSVQHNVKICLLAPTGRAAKRIEESTGMPAKTIHRELYSIPDADMLDYDLIVVDESSMIDLSLMHWLFSRIKSNSRVVLIGDYDQLEPVQEGKIFEDMVLSEKIKTVILNKGYRYEKGLIHDNAYNVNNNKSFKLPEAGDKESDFYFMSFNRVDNFFENKVSDFVINLYCKHLKERKGIDPVKDVQILVPMKKGILGVFELNQKIQNTINPFTQASNEIKYGDKTFRKNDKIIQIENNYNKGVYNGDIGYVIKIKDKKLTIKFQDVVAEYEIKELDQIQLAYVITIHKSQGCEFPYIIMPMVVSYYNMLTKKILYTGITRGKKMVMVVGEENAINISVSDKNRKDRRTILKVKLKGTLV
jgi:exodeoxyribonuclease V alpha subunit